MAAHELVSEDYDVANRLIRDSGLPYLNAERGGSGNVRRIVVLTTGKQAQANSLLATLIVLPGYEFRGCKVARKFAVRVFKRYALGKALLRILFIEATDDTERRAATTDLNW